MCSQATASWQGSTATVMSPQTIGVRAWFKWTHIVSLATVLFLGLPILCLVLCPTQHHMLQAIGDQVTREALVLSVITSTISTLIVVFFGGVLAYVLARHAFPGRMLVDTLIDLPIVMPPMVTGLALLMLLGRHGALGSWLGEHGIAITFTSIAVVIAQVFVALPFFVRAARAGFESINPRLEHASLLLGASPRQTFFKVIVPTVWPPLLAGAILAWARCLGEFGATLVFAGNFQGVTQTMPLAIFGALQDNIDVAIALSIILLATSFLLVVLLKVVSKKCGAVGVAP